MLRIITNRFNKLATQNGRKMMSSTTTAAGQQPMESYSVPVQFFHWTMGICLVGATGSALAAQKTDDKQLKQRIMFTHKSFGLLACFLLGPRLIARYLSKTPAPLPGSSALEETAAKVGHVALYGLAIALPVSGVVMGSFSGFGLPFFYTTFPSIKKDPSISKPAYEFHKLAGQVMEYMIPLHVAGAMYHVFKGQAIFGRIIGFLNKTPKVPKA